MKVCLNCNHRYTSFDWHCSSCGYRPSEVCNIHLLAPSLAYSGGGFKAEYFSKLITYEATSFWFKARNELILWSLRNELYDGIMFCEIGCGTGCVLSAIAAAYPNLKLTGSEVFIDGLSHAFARVPSAELLQMDARRIPFENQFHCIGVFDVLEHIQEDKIVLAQIFTALKPKGAMLLTVPQHPWLWSSVDDYACHVRRYTQDELVQKVREAGFSICYLSSFVSLLLPVMALQRLSSRNQSYNPDDVFKISPLLNALLYLVMRFELILLRLGLRFPVGGSLLLLARKP
jgi:SAM-dependent methyltransferase